MNSETPPPVQPPSNLPTGQPGPPANGHCPQCGTSLSAQAAQGLCPTCLMRQVAEKTDAGRPDGSGNTADSFPSVEEIGQAFPELEVLKMIGSGGMGIVYQARQRRLDRLVALKLLPKSLAADPTFAERFLREGRVLARMNHPNIVAVHDFGDRSGFFYMVMEYVDGVNLRQAMRAGRFTPSQALGVVPKICDALQYAHEEGILHRDIKPENILIDDRGRIKIADFGIAKLTAKSAQSFTLTQSGASLGTPAYMAPEQIEKPSDVDHRADIYSLGVVLYEMLTGELPLGRFSPPSEKSDVDARIDEIVMRTLEKERSRRFQSADEMKTHVENVRQPSAPSVGSAFSSAPPGNAPSNPPSHPTPAVPLTWNECWTSYKLLGVVGMVVVGWFIWAVMFTGGNSGDAAEFLIGGGFLVGLLTLGRFVLMTVRNESAPPPLRSVSSLTFWARIGMGAGIFGLFLGLAGVLGARTHTIRELAVFSALLGGLGVIVLVALRKPNWKSKLRDLAKTAEATVRSAVAPVASGVPPTPTPMGAPSAAPSPPKVPWSVMAIVSAVFAALSLVPLMAPVLLYTVHSVERIVGESRSPMAVGAAELVVVGMTSFLPGLIGTILGWVSLGQIREAAGKLRGRRLALFGAWGWIGGLICFALIIALMVTVASALHLQV